MNLTENQIKKLIKIITEEVVNRLKSAGKSAGISFEQGVLVLIPSFVPDSAAIKKAIKKKYKDTIDCAVFEDIEFNDQRFEINKISDKSSRESLMSGLKYYKDIILAAPPLGLLKRIANGDDSGFVEQVVMRCILWGKDVTVLLDFDAPKFKRGTFFESVVDSIDALTEMGLKVQSVKSSMSKQKEDKTLVTETEVMQAYKDKTMRIKCAPGAIITPLAKDRAKELGVAIDL